MIDPAHPTRIDDVSFGALVDLMSPLLGLRVDRSWCEAVVANLRATAKAADLVLAFPLDDELEPAPVFSA